MASSSHTFLFTDLVGFTALAAERGDLHAADTAVGFYDRVRGLVAEHRAEEVKTIGDALMLRCDDPALALRLGVRIVTELEAIEDFPAVRVGMHTGSAVFRANDWYGTTVNVASRLCAAAGGGEVLASEATCDAAGEIASIELDERRLHWLKNVTEPVGAHVVREREHPCRWERLQRKRAPSGLRRLDARGAVS
jgi:class 3 adenylate cyclase